MIFCACLYSSFFFFNDTATTEIYTLSLHDALPISAVISTLVLASLAFGFLVGMPTKKPKARLDRKSTRLNSSHNTNSYAVFCLKKKKIYHQHGNNPSTVLKKIKFVLCNTQF